MDSRSGRCALRRMMAVLGPCLCLSMESVRAEPPAPPTALTASDHPNDTGESVDLEWTISADDRPEWQPRRVRGYEIRRRIVGSDSPPVFVGETPYGIGKFTDRQAERGVEYLYQVTAVTPSGEQSTPAQARPVVAVRQWFDRSREGFAFILLLVCGAVVWFTRLARLGRQFHVRQIAGLAAIEEAVGRATEMGRPCLFVPGLQDMNEVATVAGINVLSRVAHTVAEYDASLVVPTARAMVMTAARETVQSACLAAGRPEAYDENAIYYVTDEQFAYVAHITGYMVRERPAACFYAGTFFAESLILGETGNLIGALQIAGTSEASQLPFFVAACDYTLIGEELFAASAYLSREPHQLGSLKGQDFGKLVAGVLLLVGCILATAVSLAPGGWHGWRKMLAFVTETLLGSGGGGTG